ncbi:hypothetical protein D1007_34726 [Hordeum vulgare]|nr:hypothetical protein D1007_34726 [Hordeum vulgare]
MQVAPTATNAARALPLSRQALLPRLIPSGELSSAPRLMKLSGAPDLLHHPTLPCQELPCQMQLDFLHHRPNHSPVSKKGSALPFGGKIVVLGGGFKQVLPVVEGASDEELAQIAQCVQAVGNGTITVQSTTTGVSGSEKCILDDLLSLPPSESILPAIVYVFYVSVLKLAERRFQLKIGYFGGYASSNSCIV